MVKITKEEAQYLRGLKKDMPITVVNKQATKGKKKKRWVQHDKATLSLIATYKKEHEKIIYEYPVKEK